MSKTGKKIAISTIAAAAAGYVAGILTAPKSGKETRKDIQETAIKAKNEAAKNLNKLQVELSDVIVEAKHKVKNLQDSAKNELSSALDKAQKTKDKAREVLSALHEGESDDQDLKLAVAEVKESIRHLKSFLKT
ncbi:YtxH domain-containing protein [Candidatus Saccharibacteria bacterium]|nr:YtxH domain-containing protein [Candidatus Saccharibacteria bacterium]MBI3338094.1 YtxH domain-containing protein [Candidatus Saccharibacteria bacterium]